MLFARADDPAAQSLFPDDRSDAVRELSRYKMMRFASRIGFSPPYFYDRHLRQRLHRYKGPALLIWGEHDRMVPRAHAEAYREGLAQGGASHRQRRGPQPASGETGRDGGDDRRFYALTRAIRARSR